MNVRGRTTRLILSALGSLSDARHVVVIAHPANEAFRIVEEIHHYADELGIPCAVSERNEMDFMSEVPLLYTRPFGWTPMILRRCDPQPVILIDHSAVFERASGIGVGVGSVGTIGRAVHPLMFETEKIVRETNGSTSANANANATT